MTLLRILRGLERAAKRAERERIKRWKAEEREQARLEREALSAQKAVERAELKQERAAIKARAEMARYETQLAKEELEELKTKETLAFGERVRERDNAKWKILREALK